MTDSEKYGKAAKAIKAMLELENIQISLKDVREHIKDKDLSDLVALKVQVAGQLKNESPARRETIGAFIVQNWEAIKDNPIVKQALFNAYCMGRYTKEQRSEMINQLLEKVKEMDHRRFVF